MEDWLKEDSELDGSVSLRSLEKVELWLRMEKVRSVAR